MVADDVLLDLRDQLLVGVAGDDPAALAVDDPCPFPLLCSVDAGIVTPVAWE
jgi:hypothetical protein